ncbi:hypothetical protein Tco_1171178 [Tanacetum coccineum]
MLTSKWHTLNVNCQKFNAAYKRAKRLGKSGENDVDYLKRAQSIYRDEHKGVAFSQEDAWAVLRFHPKWDAPEQVDLTGDVPGATQEDLFDHRQTTARQENQIRCHGEHRFLALGWHLEEIHVTWAHLEKKRTRLQTYTKYHEELFIQSVETASKHKATSS